MHHDDPAFGYRFIADELGRLGHRASENRVWRLCSEQRLWSAHAKKRGLSRRPGPPVHDDLVKRDFSASVANQLWLTDITEHRTAEGKLYCYVKDVFSNRIVGYATDSHMTAQLAVRALSYAVDLRGPGATVVHSDRGSQFLAPHLRAVSGGFRPAGIDGTGGGLRRQRGRRVVLLTAPEERPQLEVLGHAVEELRLAIVHWIERTYHRRRRQRALGRLTPIEYETIYNVAPAA